MQDASATPVVPLPQNQVPVTPLSSRLRSSFGSSMGGGAPIASAQTPTPPIVATPVPTSPPVQTQQFSAVTDVISDGDKLGILSAVIDQLEAEQPSTAQVQQSTVQPQGSVLDQALPGVVTANTDTLNPAAPVGSSAAKERVAGSDQTAVEAAAGVQYVEQEPNPEIPVEVENFIQRVTDHAQTAPTEVVIADGTQEQPAVAYPSRPVIVLPISQQIEDEGEKMSPKFSIRWLVEWSHKIIKMFAGKVIYRQAEAEN